jgi:endonuclease-3 related protein
MTRQAIEGARRARGRTRAKTLAGRLGSAPTKAPSPERRPELQHYYATLYEALGPQHWWPARTPFEVIVGAILTQNTAWSNVERAITNLRREKLLTPAALERVNQRRLERLIRSSGYFRQKARKLKEFTAFLRREYRGSLACMFRTPTAELRERLLAVHGIGRETADSILLYAGGHGVFVVDAYTKRILARHALAHEKASYEEVRALFESSLPQDTATYNEFHGLIVNVGKNWCRTQKPRCEECPLQPFLPPEHRAAAGEKWRHKAASTLPAQGRAAVPAESLVTLA